ncbi:nucleoside transporter family [Phyllosticta citribraziliensis]|uniref:Nucleoside transporter family n=1 Tax=Phyllosticta citribraziliensis TaxID=989973 RepID=A0ABR1L4M0_9PEZI
MDRMRKLFGQEEQAYEPLEGGSVAQDGERPEDDEKKSFTWLEYSIFLLLGVAMLWAWNMFLAAGPYFQGRFKSNEKILHTFQSTQLSVSTVVNLGSMLLLAKMQAKASYPKRIGAALVINVVTFTLLAISTRHFLDISAKGYFAFMVIMVTAASFASSLCGNGIFAYVSGFGREEYTQAIMAGQGVAGVLPPAAQIISVLSIPNGPGVNEGDVERESGKSAFAYFMTATFVSAITFVAFSYLVSRQRRASRMAESIEDLRSTASLRETVPLLTLFRKLFWLAAAVFLDFAVTMVFPVFTQEIRSVRPTESAPRLLQPASFIPLAFLFWNIGDLLGRILPAVPALSLTSKPRAVFGLSVARIVFVPLYLLCNVGGAGAAVKSDFFYLVVVQMGFGVTNGFIGSTCMIGAPEWVDVNEREAAGAFMGLCLVAGLAAGSLSSFAVAALLL